LSLKQNYYLKNIKYVSIPFITQRYDPHDDSSHVARCIIIWLHTHTHTHTHTSRRRWQFTRFRMSYCSRILGPNNEIVAVPSKRGLSLNKDYDIIIITVVIINANIIIYHCGEPMIAAGNKKITDGIHNIIYYVIYILFICGSVKIKVTYCVQVINE